MQHKHFQHYSKLPKFSLSVKFILLTLPILASIPLIPSLPFASAAPDQSSSNFTSGCVYISEKTASVRFFKVAKLSDSEFRFSEISGNSILIKNDPVCPKTPYLPNDCGRYCNISTAVANQSSTSNINRFELSENYHNHEKFSSIRGQPTNIFINNVITSIYGTIENDRTYIALNEFCFIFGCNYGYLNEANRKNQIITVSYSISDLFRLEVDHKIGSRSYQSYLLYRRTEIEDWDGPNAREIAKSRNNTYTVTADVPSKLFGQAQSIRNIADPQTIAFNSSDILVPIRFLAEGLHQRVSYDQPSNSVHIDDLSTNIHYSKDESGTFIFINGPESLYPEQLADSLQPKLFYETEFQGKTEIYYEHNFYNKRAGGGIIQDTQGKLFYALRFTNPSSSPVTLTVHNCGLSTNDISYTLGWKQYHASPEHCVENQQTSFTIEANGSLYLWHGGSNNGQNDAENADNNGNDPGIFLTDINKVRAINPKNTTWAIGFYGILNVTASSKLKVAALGLRSTDSSGRPDLSKIKNAKYLGDDDDDENELSGRAAMKNRVKNEVTFVVNDYVSGNLPIKINNREDKYWISNDSGCQDTTAAMTDTIHIQVIHNDQTYLTGSLIDFLENPKLYQDPRLNRNGQAHCWNVANWAVHYQENIIIQNLGDNERELTFYIGTSTPGTSKNIAITNLNITGATLLSSKENQYVRIKDTAHEIWHIKVPASSTAKIDTTITFGGNGSRGLTHRVELK
jgi:hypothetical protein